MYIVVLKKNVIPIMAAETAESLLILIATKQSNASYIANVIQCFKNTKNPKDVFSYRLFSFSRITLILHMRGETPDSKIYRSKKSSEMTHKKFLI